MYTFLVIVGDHGNSLPLLEKSYRISKALMPTAQANVNFTLQRIPQMNGGWFYSTPEPSPNPSLISESINEELAILVFGDIYESTGKSASDYVRESWNRGREEAARAINGNFSAIIADLKERSVYIVSDLLGRRTLRYHRHGCTLMVSNHDVPIVATGICPTDLDLISACSIVACDWSIRGDGLLSQVKVCHPFEYIHWRNGETHRVRRPTLTLDHRIDPKDEAACERTVQSMADQMRMAMSSFVRNRSEVHVDLTAGMDSRATFALALSVTHPSRLVAHTSGSHNSQDAAMAHKIAVQCGVRHELDNPVSPTPEAFLSNCRTMAYFENGSTNSKRALRTRLAYNAANEPVVGGELSEIFRGYYYPQDAKTCTPLGLDQARHKLLSKVVRGLPWRDGELGNAVRDRLDRVITEFAGLSRDGWDILDMCYLFERVARWAGGSRTLWTIPKYMPFGTVDLVKLAYQLPSPIGLRCHIQRELIISTLPFTYTWKFNGQSSLADRHSRRRRLIHMAAQRSLSLPKRAAGFLKRRIWRKGHATTKSHEAIRAKLFSTPLGPVVRDTLLAPDSVSREIFGPHNLECLIHSHMEYRKNHLQTLGFLMTMEQWKCLIRDASTMAK